MRPKTRPDEQDAKRLVRGYETLRANVFGELNGPYMLALFLRKGMSAWLRTLIGSGTAPGVLAPSPSTSAHTSMGTQGPSAELATILVDAILEATRPGVRAWEGNR